MGNRLLKFVSLEWVPVTTALVSLAFSVGTLFISTRGLSFLVFSVKKS